MGGEAIGPGDGEAGVFFEIEFEGGVSAHGRNGSEFECVWGGRGDLLGALGGDGKIPGVDGGGVECAGGGFHVVVVDGGDFFAHEDDVGGGASLADAGAGFEDFAEIFGEVFVEEIGVGVGGVDVAGAEHDFGGCRWRRRRWGDRGGGRI